VQLDYNSYSALLSACDGAQKWRITLNLDAWHGQRSQFSSAADGHVRFATGTRMVVGEFLSNDFC